ncbi:MAG: hypothetical protein COT91_00725 [Candidatus Doudnabacteria bacterium CG10_big_fil_rev_8_21_14_0_10_41_10]|uniref:DNA-directed DNA polymerase n=1 Tax=Candidatus Doudnabacteria bacterium CG10_big_fil_rev_8_21_14_0_10_41_10 TaxID=1974551 RepID=A0A2H0VER6_9BACT|nr:MAG: hypothetical protein COT91_00725 [Candidatus Doudnabacteria bacterium CG10_big_fil_rev_8_21_14_0_10_41_10]
MSKTKATTKSKPRIFLFQGEDDYTAALKVKEWKNAFSKKYSSSGIKVVDADEFADGLVENIKNSIASTGLFSQTQLIIVKNIFQQKIDVLAGVAELLPQTPEDTFLIFWEKKTVKKNLKLYKKLIELEKKGQAKMYDFKIPGGVAFDGFIKSYSEKHGASMERNAVNKLARLLGRDLQERVKTSFGYEAKQVFNLWQVTNEIEKLATYAKGAVITEKDVTMLVSAKFSENIFQITEALGSKNIKKTQALLDQMIDTTRMTEGDVKGKALVILGALAAQFRGLLQLHDAKNGNSLQGLGWSPFRIRANERLLNYFSEKELREIMKKLLVIDKKLKSTNLPPKVLFSNFISELVR